MRGTIAIVLVACSGRPAPRAVTPTAAPDAAIAAAPDAAPTAATTPPAPPPPSLLDSLPAQDFAPPLSLAAVPADQQKASTQLNIAGLVLHRKQDFAGAEAKYLAALAADPGNLIARYNLACVYNRSGRSPQGLRLLLEMATAAGCADCVKVVDHARWDDEWRSQWPEEVFWRVLEREIVAGDPDDPTPTCPKGTKLHGEWDPNKDFNEVYCVKGSVKQGPYRLLELGYDLNEGSRSASGDYDKGKKQGLWSESESFGHSTFGAYLADQRHGLWIDAQKDGTAYQVYDHGALDGRQRSYLANEQGADILVSEETYDHGKKNGTFRYWTSDGKLLGETTIDHDTGDWIVYDASGALTARGKLVGGLADGAWGEWDAGWWEGTYARGKRTGRWARFDGEGGAKTAEGAYEAGRRTGAWTYWTSDGKLLAKGGFAGGQLDGAWKVHGDDDAVQALVFRKGKLVKVDGKRASKGEQRDAIGFADDPVVIGDAEPMGMPGWQ